MIGVCLFLSHFDTVCTNEGFCKASFPTAASQIVKSGCEFKGSCVLQQMFFLFGPCSVFFFVVSFFCLLDAAHMNFDAIQGLLYSMSQWWWKENRRTEAWPEPWC